MIKLNSTKHSFYKDYYCKESRTNIEEFYNKDFEYFEYEYE